MLLPKHKILLITLAQEFKFGWRQVCAYAFPRKLLKKFNSISNKTLLESVEDLEILRFLEIGLGVKMIQMSDLSIAVDTPEDIVRVESVLND